MTRKNYELWEMSNRCKVIVYRRSKRNMVKLMTWLSNRADEKGRVETFNMGEIRKQTGLNMKQISHYTMLLSQKKNPFIRMTVGETKDKKHKGCGIKPFYKIKLIRRLL